MSLCPVCKRLIGDHTEQEADACIGALHNKPLWPSFLIGAVVAVGLLVLAHALIP